MYVNLPVIKWTPFPAICGVKGYSEAVGAAIVPFTVRIVSMATYGTNARVLDIVRPCRRRVRYGSVEGIVGVLASGIVHDDLAQASC